ncbi:hypothetical protein [Aliivibrio fischeri]|uniref:hypothetical protein n=1 Tax=Aliivibrio fischeri TaxID=668 RepID=UPI0012D9BC0A|nr:hypothetical protein [Aliivibrio fischeri]MUJ21701.1 hypothetical protein [Aliivibrio fischeri]
MEFIVNLFKEGYYEGVLIIIFFSIVANFAKFIDFYDFNRKRRIKDLYEAVNSPKVGQQLKSQLEHEIEVEHFKIIYKVRVNKELLDAIFVLHNRIGKSLSFRHLVRAASFNPCILGIEEPSYRIKLSFFDKVVAKYNLVVGLFLLLFSFLLIGYFWVNYTTELNWGYLINGIACIVIGCFMVREGLPLKSVSFVNEALDELDHNS